MATKAAGIDFYKDWLGIPEEHRPPDHYRLLGLEPLEEDRGKIEEAWLARTKTLRARQLDPRHGAVVQDLLNELAYAETVLTDQGKKRVYDEKLRSAVSLDEADPDAGVVVDLAPYVVGGQARVGAVAAQVSRAGQVRRVACPRCGHENQKGKLVCRNCGGYLASPPRRRFAGLEIPGWTWPVAGAVVAVAIVIGLVFALLSAFQNSSPPLGGDGEGGEGSDHASGEPRDPNKGQFQLLFNRTLAMWARLDENPRQESILATPLCSLFVDPEHRSAVAARDGSLVVWGRQDLAGGVRFPARGIEGTIQEIGIDRDGKVYVGARGQPIRVFEPSDSDVRVRSLSADASNGTAAKSCARVMAVSADRKAVAMITGGEASGVTLVFYVAQLGGYRVERSFIPGVVGASCAAVDDHGRLAVATARGILVFEGTPPSPATELHVPGDVTPAQLAMDPGAGVAALLAPAPGDGSARIVWLEKPGEAKLDTDLEGPIWFGPVADGMVFVQAKRRAVRMWFASRGRASLLREFVLPEGTVATAVGVAAGSMKAVAVGLSDGRLLVWDEVASFRFPKEIRGVDVAEAPPEHVTIQGTGHPSGGPPGKAPDEAFDALYNRARERWNRVQEPRQGSVLSSRITDLFLVPRGTTAVAAEGGSVAVWSGGEGVRFTASALHGKIEEIRFDALGHVYIAAKWEAFLEFDRTATRPLHRLGPTAARASRQPIAVSPGRGRVAFLTAGEKRSVLLRVIEEVVGKGIVYTADMKEIPGAEGAFCAAIQDDGRLAVASGSEVRVFMGTPPAWTASLPLPKGAEPAWLAFDPEAGVAALLPPAAGEGRTRIAWLERPGEAFLDDDFEGATWFGPEPYGLLLVRAKGNVVKIWFASQGEFRLLREFALPPDSVATAVTVDPQIPILAVGLADGSLVVWDRAGAFTFPVEMSELPVGSSGETGTRPLPGAGTSDPPRAGRGESDLHGTWNLVLDKMWEEFKSSDQYRNIPESSRADVEEVVRELYSNTRVTFSEGKISTRSGDKTEEARWRIVSRDGNAWNVETQAEGKKAETGTLEWMDDDHVKLISKENGVPFTIWLVRRK
ncbi:MAG: zinc ribbon domain-containing protein [Planctomycetes bacterium]|nr:zinc ribbon domain-containing protein [Planctomycetota bacterium]